MGDRQREQRHRLGVTQDMPSSLTTWWMKVSRLTTRALGVRGRLRGSASVSLVLGATLLFGGTSIARSDAGGLPRLSDAVLGVATPALHSTAHRTLADASFPRRWLAPLDLAHPARAVSLHALRFDASDRAASVADASYSGITARGYDATAPPDFMS